LRRLGLHRLLAALPESLQAALPEALLAKSCWLGREW
jgi:hypothetical protein